jgi:hypothetical protein
VYISGFEPSFVFSLNSKEAVLNSNRIFCVLYTFDAMPDLIRADA